MNRDRGMTRVRLRDEAAEFLSRSSSESFPASLGQCRASARRNVWETRLRIDVVPSSWLRSRVSP